jgi:carbon monoxide dehydrogenase subunit G
MELSHTFTVPATVDQTWATFMDLPLVGSCFPGATVTEVTEEGFSGTVKVKLGPIAMVYSGTGAFVERDDSAHRAVIDAKGKDKRGNGTAGATVTIQLTDVGDGSTRADVQTDLAVTGKPAQFGRGVMQDVSDKLLGQFISCIEGKIGDANPPAAAEASPDAPTGAVAAVPVPATEVPTPAPEVPAAQVPAPAPEVAAAEVPTPAPEVAAAEVPTPATERQPTRTSRSEGKDDALDLGSTVLPILLRTYGKQVAVGVVVIVAVVVIWRAMSG